MKSRNEFINSSFALSPGNFNKPDFSKVKPKSKTSKIDSLKKDVGKGATPKNGMTKATEIVKLIGELSNTHAGKVVLTLVANGVTSVMNGSKDMVPGYYGSSTLTSKVGVDETRNYIIRFHAGYKSTKSVLEAERQHGSCNIQISNSLSDATDTYSRGYLKRVIGFNTKSFDFLNEKFYSVVSDYNKLYKLNEWEIPEHSTQVPYGLVKSEFSNIKVRNSNSYHKIIVKIHVVKILDDDRTLHSLYKSTFNEKVTVQKNGAIPTVYQITDLNSDDVIKNPFMNSCITYNGASLSMSASFKSQAKVVKTFSKTLGPGDTFDFRMTHHCGPGLRFDTAKVYLNNVGQGNQPTGYGFIVETVGTPCELVRVKDKAVFQGTCPGWYNFEYRTGITLIKNSTVISSYSDLNKAVEQKYAIKVHEREFLTKRPLAVQSDKIGQPGEKDIEYFIASLSAESKVYAGPVTKTTADPSPNDDMDYHIQELANDEQFDNQNEEEVYDEFEQ